jgi:hypothetical protein
MPAVLRNVVESTSSLSCVLLRSGAAAMQYSHCCVAKRNLVPANRITDIKQAILNGGIS